jgi:hypothetical protein
MLACETEIRLMFYVSLILFVGDLPSSSLPLDRGRVLSRHAWKCACAIWRARGQKRYHATIRESGTLQHTGQTLSMVANIRT